MCYNKYLSEISIAFVAQQMGMDYIEPFTFNCIRFLIGFIVLQPCIYLLDKKRTASGAVSAAPVTSEDKKTLYLGALCCGLPLAFASAAQQTALVYSPAG